MFGVVLWSDAEDDKAVIWCEDHGDLAFYRQNENGESKGFDPGDWVEFDMTTDRHMRFAHNPRLVAEGVFPELPDSLGAIRPIQISSAVPAHQSRGTAEIIPFLPTHTESHSRDSEEVVQNSA